MHNILARLRAAARSALARIGEPERLAFGETEMEVLGLYRTDRTNGPIHVYIHGGAWRSGSGSGRSAAIAERFVRSGAHFIAPDYVLVQDAGGSFFPVELLVGENYNHFEILETLANPLGLLGHAALAQMGLLEPSTSLA